jgi:hypothetical protein
LGEVLAEPLAAHTLAELGGELGRAQQRDIGVVERRDLATVPAESGRYGRESDTEAPSGAVGRRGRAEHIDGVALNTL